MEFDIAMIVPSTRDLLQVLATRRQNLALVGEIDGENAATEASRLDEANISALALTDASEPMTAAARATKTVPALLLTAVASREECQRARFYGADGVCISVALPPAEWDALAKVARGMRMLPLALVHTEADVELAMKAGARALLLRAATAGDVLALAQKAPRSVTLVADIATVTGGGGEGDLATTPSRAESAATADALRTLSGKVDSAVVPSVVHTSPDFEELVEEVDP